MSHVNLKGEPVEIGGQFPQKGEKAPDFNLANQKRENVSLENYSGKRKILNIFPSIDTPTCALSVKRFNDEVSKLNNTVVLCISADLPFAQKRFCGSEGIDRVENISDYLGNNFGSAYGILIKDKGLLARAVFVLDKDNTVKHVEYVPEIASEPNFEAALSVIKSLV